MNYQMHFLAVALTLLLCLSGCGTSTIANSSPPPLPQQFTVDPPPGSTVLTANTYAGDALASMLLKRIDAGKSILVAAFNDMENTQRSSPFGRTSMQQVSSRLSQHGFQIIESRLGNSLRINEKQGELMLTRDASRLLIQEYEAHAALVGMYSMTRSTIFVSVRIARLSDGALLAAYEYYIPNTNDASALLHKTEKDNNSAAFANKKIWNRFAKRTQILSKNASNNRQTHFKQAVQKSRPEQKKTANSGENISPSLMGTYATHPNGKIITP